LILFYKIKHYTVKHSDYTIFCTLRAAVRQQATAGCIAAARGGGRWLRRQHLLHSTGSRSAAGSCRLQGCCSRGARRLRLHHLLYSAGRSPAAGSCRFQSCCSRGARRLRLHHPLHSAGRRPAASSGWWHSYGARGGSLAPTKPSSASYEPPSFCTLRAAVRQPAPACCWTAARGGPHCPAGFDDNIFCTLLAAVRQPASAAASADCRAAARWGSCSDDTMFCHLRAAVRQSASAGCWRLPPNCTIWCPQPSNRITPSHTCTIHLMGPTPTPVDFSGESIHSPVGPLSFFLLP
jgi:hypothetical protein